MAQGKRRTRWRSRAVTAICKCINRGADRRVGPSRRVGLGNAREFREQPITDLPRRLYWCVSSVWRVLPPVPFTAAALFQAQQHCGRVAAVLCAVCRLWESCTGNALDPRWDGASCVAHPATGTATPRHGRCVFPHLPQYLCTYVHCITHTGRRQWLELWLQGSAGRHGFSWLAGHCVALQTVICGRVCRT